MGAGPPGRTPHTAAAPKGQDHGDHGQQRRVSTCCVPSTALSPLLVSSPLVLKSLRCRCHPVPQMRRLRLGRLSNFLREPHRVNGESELDSRTPSVRRSEGPGPGQGCGGRLLGRTVPPPSSVPKMGMKALGDSSPALRVGWLPLHLARPLPGHSSWAPCTHPLTHPADSIAYPLPAAARSHSGCSRLLTLHTTCSRRLHGRWLPTSPAKARPPRRAPEPCTHSPPPHGAPARPAPPCQPAQRRAQTPHWSPAASPRPGGGLGAWEAHTDTSFGLEIWEQGPSPSDTTFLAWGITTESLTGIGLEPFRSHPFLGAWRSGKDTGSQQGKPGHEPQTHSGPFAKASCHTTPGLSPLCPVGLPAATVRPPGPVPGTQ